MNTLTKNESLRTILKCVPQWLTFRSSHEHSISLDEETIFFYTKIRLTTKQIALKHVIESHIKQWYQHICSLPKNLAVEYIKHQMALNWLKIHSKSILWHELLDFLGDAASRTYENRPPIKNIIISNCPENNSAHINEHKIQKTLDPIACSLFTYIGVDCKMHVQKYDQANWCGINDNDTYKLHPEFLHALYGEIPNHGFSAHLTTQKDIVILEKKKYHKKINNKWKHYDSGLILTKRKGSVYLYEPANFKNTIHHILGHKPSDYYVASNIFEILFDLSFMRKGSLLIYDPDDKISEKIQNKESFLDQKNNDKEYRKTNFFTEYARNISLGNRDRSSGKKRILLELANIDGAVVFNQNSIVAVGAMIKPHHKATGMLGARSIASYSAACYGAHPFKVSSDGEVTMFIRTQNDLGNEEYNVDIITFT